LISVSNCLRRLIVYTDYGLVGDYQPSTVGFSGFEKGVKPSDLAGEE
jgi:hypothetical protein